jgi:opacity protein-like surface antigen
MPVKKLTLLSFVLILLFSNAFAQNKDSTNSKPKDIQSSKFYYQIGIGYNFSSNGETFTQKKEYKDDTYELTRVPGSWGKGFDIGFGLGCKITRTLGIELELGYLIGSKIKEENQFNLSYNGIPGVDKQSATYKANTFRINPKIIFEIPLKNENSFYGKIGYQLGFGNGKIDWEETASYSNGGTGTGSYEFTRTGGLISGTTTALGFRFKVEKNISFFMEATANNLSRKFTKSELTYCVENSQNTIDSRTTYFKETHYLDNIMVDPNVPIDTSKPREILSFRSNYSSVGFRIGFITHF